MSIVPKPTATWLIKVLILYVGLCFAWETQGQSYLQRLTNPSLSQQQQLARFSNGDILIGDSSFEESTGDGTEPLFLSRIDPCGFVVWSYTYEKRGFFLLFNDLVIDDQDNIIVFGTASEGEGATLFLLQLNENGQTQQFKFFQSETPSHAAYSLDLKDNKILVFGSILRIGAPRTGFVAKFNTDLNIEWAKRINPFTFEGDAIFTSNNEIIGRSGAMHYKFDTNGELQWIKQFDFTLDPAPIGGPYPIAGGFLFEAFFENKAFFYKLDDSGQLIWKSGIFSSSSFAAAIQETTNGHLIAHLSAPEGSTFTFHQLSLSPAGNILNQKKLSSSFNFNVGSVFHSFGKDGRVNLIGNDDALTETSIEKTDYLIQYSPDELSTDCFTWLDINEVSTNNYDLSFPDINKSIIPLDMQVRPQGGITISPREMPYFEPCSTSPTPEIRRIDSLLQCNENWQVSLPSDAFTWEDNYPDPTRVLEESGTYRARNSDCSKPVIYAYNFDRLVCDCEVSLPNAFSPNGDGINDKLQIFSNCQLTEIECMVFDRWGNHIYSGKELGNLWDGTSRIGDASPGVYLVKINYTLRSESGGIQEESLAGELLLIR